MAKHQLKSKNSEVLPSHCTPPSPTLISCKSPRKPQIRRPPNPLEDFRTNNFRHDLLRNDYITHTSSQILKIYVRLLSCIGFLLSKPYPRPTTKLSHTTEHHQTSTTEGRCHKTSQKHLRGLHDQPTYIYAINHPVRTMMLSCKSSCIGIKSLPSTAPAGIKGHSQITIFGNLGKEISNLIHTTIHLENRKKPITTCSQGRASP